MAKNEGSRVHKAEKQQGVRQSANWSATPNTIGTRLEFKSGIFFIMNLNKADNYSVILGQR